METSGDGVVIVCGEGMWRRSLGLVSGFFVDFRGVGVIRIGE